ncbi:MAG TPA: hypothetical protein VF831_06410, partial [Anaerolineales bacterium]
GVSISWTRGLCSPSIVVPIEGSLNSTDQPASIPEKEMNSRELPAQYGKSAEATKASALLLYSSIKKMQ